MTQTLSLLGAPSSLRIHAPAAMVKRNLPAHKQVPLFRRGAAVYYVVQPGETMKSLLGRFGQQPDAALILARSNPNKASLWEQGKPATSSFKVLRAGEMLLIPPSFFKGRFLKLARRAAPTGALRNRLLHGTPEQQEAVLGAYIDRFAPPGDRGDEKAWGAFFTAERKPAANTLGAEGDWGGDSGGSTDDWTQIDPTSDFDWGDWGDGGDSGGGEGGTGYDSGDIDSTGDYFGVFCPSGFHREWGFKWPPVECVSDNAGMECVGPAGDNRVYVLSRDGECLPTDRVRQTGGSTQTGGGGTQTGGGGTQTGGGGTQTGGGGTKGGTQTGGGGTKGGTTTTTTTTTGTESWTDKIKAFFGTTAGKGVLAVGVVLGTLMLLKKSGGGGKGGGGRRRTVRRRSRRR